MTSAKWVESVPLTLFLVGTFLVVASRTGGLDDFLITLAIDPSTNTFHANLSCLHCHRTSAWLYLPVRWALDILSNLFFLDPTAWPFAVRSPWDYRNSAQASEAIVTIVAVIGHQVLLVLPVYWVAVRLFPGTLTRTIYILVILAAMGGWPAALINSWFSFARIFSDWPPAYYNFATFMLPYDWAGIGFLHVLALSILYGVTGPVAAFALAAFGQWNMDNLGLVTGIALGLAAWSTRGIRQGVLSVALAGLGSILTFVIIFLLGGLTMEGAGLESAASEINWSSKIAAWWGYYWEVQGKYNFIWWNVTIANFISLMIWPAIVGVILGLGFFKSRRGAPVEVAFRALLFPAIGFFITLLIGLTKSGFGSDMGRQVMPLVVIVIPLAAMTVETAWAAWVRRKEVKLEFNNRR